MSECDKITKKELICLITDELAKCGVLLEQKTINRWLREKKEEVLMEGYIRVSVARNGVDAPIPFPGGCVVLGTK